VSTQDSASAITLEDVYRARETIGNRVHRTPVFDTATLSDMADTRLSLKAENLQKTGSFKVRGAINACSALSDDEKRRGVIAVSAGNHGAAVAYGARMVGSRATVVMPETASRAKIAAIEGYGARAVLTDGPLLERMREISESEGQVFIHPFDDPHVMAGAGTVALEILEQVEGPIAAIVVPVGGGGMISGVATVIKSLRPETRVIGVEPEGSNVVSQSLQAGHPLTLNRGATIADGLNAPWSAPRSLGIIQRLADDVVTVSDAEISRAMVLIMERCKLVVEPSGAAGVAAILGGKVANIQGQTVVTVLSGGNVDLSRLGELIR
jgi:threonine dehydratase